MFLTERSPRLFSGNIHDSRFGRVGRREDREEYEPLAKRIVRSVNLAFRNQNHFAWSKDTVMLPNPLFGPTRENVNDFLACRVCVKRMRAASFHIRADHQ